MPSPLRTKAEQGELLTEIHAKARAFAIGVMDEDDAEDVASDIVLACYEKMRARTWKRPKNLQAFVRKLAKDRIADFHRDRQVELGARREHQRARSLALPEWMSPDRSWDEASIDEYQAHVMTKLPRRCRLAYYLVRVEGDTYEQAAERMQLSPETIGKYVVQAHRVFRQELRAIGIETGELARRVKKARTSRQAAEPSAVMQVTMPLAPSRIGLRGRPHPQAADLIEQGMHRELQAAH